MKNAIVKFTISVFERKYPFYGIICFKKSKLLVEAEIWNLDYFKYLEFDGIFHFVLF